MTKPAAADLALADTLASSVRLEIEGVLEASDALCMGKPLELHQRLDRLVRRATAKPCASTAVSIASGANRTRKHIAEALAATMDAEVRLTLGILSAAYADLRKASVTYVAYPSGREDVGDVVEMDFANLLFVDDVAGALAVHERLWQLPPTQQVRAAETEHLRHQLQLLDQSLAADHEGSKDRRISLERQKTGAQRRLSFCASKTTEDACAAVRDAWVHCRYNIARFPPIAVRLQGLSEVQDLLIAASCLDALALSCWEPTEWERAGAETALDAVSSAWRRVVESRYQLEVLAVWIRALAGSESSSRCDLCYRHRATRLRCQTHKCTGTQTPEVRQAHRLYPAYVDAYTSNRKAPSELQRAPVASLSPEILNAIDQVPPRSTDLRAHALRLGQMLPDLNIRFGERSSIHLLRLFRSMLAASIECSGGISQASGISKFRQMVRPDEIERFLRLSTFLTHFYAEDVPKDWEKFGVIGCGQDPDNPLTKGRPFSLSSLYEDAHRYKSWWSELMKLETTPHTMALTRANVELVRDRVAERKRSLAGQQANRPVSYRELAAEFGCSHTAIRNALLKPRSEASVRGRRLARKLASVSQ